jgi:hypothetical protein
MRTSDQVAHALTGEIGVVESIGRGKFENYIRVRWNLTGELYYHRPNFITDVSRAAGIRKSHRMKQPLPDDRDE